MYVEAQNVSSHVGAGQWQSDLSSRIDSLSKRFDDFTTSTNSVYRRFIELGNIVQSVQELLKMVKEWLKNQQHLYMSNVAHIK